MEADLSRYYGIDYRDRWRQDEIGRPRLTLRMIAVRVRHLPPDSAVVVAINGEPGWTRDQVLTADVWSALAGKEHAALAAARKSQGRTMTAEFLNALGAARRRLRERKQKIASGEIT